MQQAEHRRSERVAGQWESCAEDGRRWGHAPQAEAVHSERLPSHAALDRPLRTVCGSQMLAGQSDALLAHQQQQQHQHQRLPQPPGQVPCPSCKAPS